MRRSSILTTVLLAAAGGVLFVGQASAQGAAAPTGESRGLRYLSWSGRGEAVPASPAAAPAASGPPRRDLRRPNPVIPHGGAAATAPAPTRPGLTPAPGSGRTLTPANAWMRRAPTPPEPAMPSPVSLAPAPGPAAPRPAPVLAPDYLPDPGGRGQAVPAQMIYAQPPSPAQPARTEAFDPMAPRRDAPIFRMQQDGSAPASNAVSPVNQPAATVPPATPRPRNVAEVSPGGERPSPQGGRYYSVHRQNGRQPDSIEMPEPNYVDALAVTMPETIASQDLAAPEQGPTLIRDAQGRLRAAPAASDGDHQ